MRQFLTNYSGKGIIAGWRCSACAWVEEYPLPTVPQRRAERERFIKGAKRSWESHDCLNYPRQHGSTP